MKIQQLVITSPTALALKAAGLDTPSVFSYCRRGDTAHLKLTSDADGLFMAYAYTATELMDILPGGLKIGADTFVATGDSWVQLNEADLAYPYAHLTLIKTPDGNFVTAYYYLSWNIAFQLSDGEKIVNLISVAESPAESLAALALEVIKQGKLPGH